MRSLFSASIPPAIAACARAAIDIVSREGATLAAALRARALRFRQELAERDIDALGSDDAPIVPVLVRDAERIVRVATRLRAAGILVNMVRFPAVPQGQDRLRFVLNIGLTDDDLIFAADQLRRALSGEAP